MNISLVRAFALIALISTPAAVNAQGFAPASVAGRTAIAVITSGSGVFANGGGFAVAFPATGATYQLVPITSNVVGGTGVYSWTKTGDNTGVAQLTSSGIPATQTVTFTSSSAGTFQTTSAYGNQTGAFIFQGYSDLNPLINIATRGFVGTGSNILVGGFVIGGSIPKLVLVRGIGPGLNQFGLTGTLSTPQLAIYDSTGSVIATNIGWGNQSVPGSSSVSGNIQSASSLSFTEAGAFSISSGSADCAVVLTLPPGAYTAQVSGTNGTTGTALMEVYELPQ